MYYLYIIGKEDFDPRKRSFTEDELRPQAMIKKSKKVCINDTINVKKITWKLHIYYNKTKGQYFPVLGQ